MALTHFWPEDSYYHGILAATDLRIKTTWISTQNTRIFDQNIDVYNSKLLFYWPVLWEPKEHYLTKLTPGSTQVAPTVLQWPHVPVPVLETNPRLPKSLIPNYDPILLVILFKSGRWHIHWGSIFWSARVNLGIS